jgi:antitoxin CptB
MNDDHDIRLKKLRIRAWRRGIKEMDLVLGGYVDAQMHALSGDDLDVLEAVMAENDHDILQWVTGQQIPPARYSGLIAELGRRAAPAK